MPTRSGPPRFSACSLIEGLPGISAGKLESEEELLLDRSRCIKGGIESRSDDSDSERCTNGGTDKESSSAASASSLGISSNGGMSSSCGSTSFCTLRTSSSSFWPSVALTSILDGTASSILAPPPLLVSPLASFRGCEIGAVEASYAELAPSTSLSAPASSSRLFASPSP